MTLQISTLSNGLRVVTDHVDWLETVALGVWVNVGTRHETALLNGISHLLEHMAFKGTVHRSAREIAESIENVGGHLNAYTARENTAYFARVLSLDVPLAVDLLSDILQFSTFKQEELEKEKHVVLQEISECHDSPDDVLFDHLQEVSYPHQALGRPVLGQSHSVAKLSRDALQKYMTETYAASQMILVASGKVDHRSLCHLAEEKFSFLQREATLNPEPGLYQGGHLALHRDLEQVHMILGFEALPLGHDHYYVLAILAALLGGGMSSRIFQEVREKRGLAYSVYGFTSSFSDTGLMGFYVGTGERESREALKVIGDILGTVGETLQVSEVERVKAQLKASLLMALENMVTRCEQLAHQMTIYGRPLSQTEIVDRIEAVTLEQIRDLARSIFGTAPVFTSIGPSLQIPTYEEVCHFLGQTSSSQVSEKIAV